jgi:hypothetical protein
MAMSLAERLTTSRPEYKPSMQQWIDSLTDEDAAALVAAGLDPAWTNPALVDVIAAEGFTIGTSAVAEWRKRLGFTR